MTCTESRWIGGRLSQRVKEGIATYRRLASTGVLFLSVLLTYADRAVARDLTFEERVKAQEAIERVYYSHQIGTTKSFEQAVPRSVLERKVRTYLKESVALEKFWQTPVTADMLQKELERMARHTRMPERLRDLYTALGSDPFMIQECLARPLVVGRMARSFFLARSETGQSSWEDWWKGTEDELDEGSVHAIASGGDLRPLSDIPSVASSVSCPTDDVWDNGSLAHFPEGRGNHTAVWTGSQMIVWGGDTGGGLDSGGRYDPATDTWAPVSRAGAPAPRAQHSAVWTGTEMIIWGGMRTTPGGTTVYPDAGGRYDPFADAWRPVSTTSEPSPRFRHTAVWTGRLMVVWGGFAIDNLDNTGGRYDPVTDTWSPVSQVGAPGLCVEQTAVWTGSLMVVWGGSNPSFDGLCSGGARYDPSADSWSLMSVANGPTPRTGHTAVWTGSQMIVWGGTDASHDTVNTGGRYDPAADTWLPTSTIGSPVGRTGHTDVWTGQRMIVWGGRSNYTGVEVGSAYDPAADTWQATSTTNAPSVRLGHTAVWTGTLVVVWGGSIDLGTGGRYDPQTDTWTPTSMNPAPFGRYEHSAVWTGNFMIVWGGSIVSNGLDLNTGGRYDPVVDDWLPTSTINAPLQRRNHTAIWTGNVMIVWGGVRGSFPFYDQAGGRYDPVGDTWVATSSTGAPTGRELHTAVWTGTEMVVWGGAAFRTTAFLSTGGRYNPATDTWRPTSTVGVTTARNGQTAVWTGSKMIVWGGSGPGSLPIVGGRYDPVTDTWSQTSAAGAPEGRTAHTAVWTGSQMIVWGGQNYFNVLGTGGRYDPATDTWSQTSATGAPEARAYHTAVWTGSAIVVWGGNSDRSLDSGGRYEVATDTWQPTSLTTAPEPRSGPTGVWTGDQMIVWGGGGMDSGGRYCSSCPLMTYYLDTDGDGHGDASRPLQSCSQPIGYVVSGDDCNDSDANDWGTPSEVRDLLFGDGATLVWMAPAFPGTTTDFFDLIRSGTPADFVTSAICVASHISNITATDAASPAPGAAFFYLVRAQDGCPNGQGSLGTTSGGTMRTGRSCP